MNPRPVVLITGAARRIGRAMALEMARAGHDVAVHYRASVGEAQALVAELQTLGVQAQAFGADLAIEAECEALLPAVLAQFGRMDALVNNASSFAHDDVASFSYALMEQMWRANTGPAVLLARALHRHALAAQRQACVVNVLDQKLWNPNPDYFSYTLSKAALQCANTLLAQALAPSVRVCAVAPGLTLPSGPMSEESFAQAHRMTPLQRASTPDDIARAVRFLIESPAITGTTLLVDGGQHLMAQPRDVMYLAPGGSTNQGH